MPTLEELQAADMEHAQAIAALKARIDGHDGDIARHDSMILKLNETVAVLREAVAKVATKDDILKLSQNIDDKFSTQLRDAHNSIPARLGVILTAGSVLVAFATLILSFARHG